jgi:hypothetical protein
LSISASASAKGLAHLSGDEHGVLASKLPEQGRGAQHDLSAPVDTAVSGAEDPGGVGEDAVYLRVRHRGEGLDRLAGGRVD